MSDELGDDETTQLRNLLLRLADTVVILLDQPDVTDVDMRAERVELRYRLARLRGEPPFPPL